MHTPSFMPHAKLEVLRLDWQSYLIDIASTLHPQDGSWLFDAASRGTFDAVMQSIDASEGTIWLKDPSKGSLVPAFNNGPQAAEFVCKHDQPIGLGIVSMVFQTESAVCESNVHMHLQHDPRADKVLNVVTEHMVVVPFYFASEIRGVISAVKLRAPGEGSVSKLPFATEAIRSLNHLADQIGTRIDARLTRFAFEGS